MSLTAEFAGVFGLLPPSPDEIAALTSITDVPTAIADMIALPEVQSQVVPVMQMFDLATGHLPIGQTLASMVSADLTQPQLANELIASSTFADFYNGGIPVNPNSPVTTALVDAMFMVGLGHAPTAATEHGFAGMTNEQAFLAIASSAAMTETQTVGIASHLTGAIELVTGYPVGGSGPNTV